MAGHSWALLPSVLIVEILSYLSLKDRLNASQACKSWRSYLFQPKLWPRISLTLHRNRRNRNNFLTDVCGRFVKECAIKFNPREISEVRDCLNILIRLRENRTIQVLQLEPSSSHFLWTETMTSARFIQAIEDVIKGCRKLKHLSLGCSEEILAYTSSIIDNLAEHHAKSLEGLHIASVKEDSETYGILDLNINQLTKFSILKHLSIDFDFVDSTLLGVFSQNSQTSLQTMVIHVHGVDPQHEIIPNAFWYQFSSHNPNVEVTLNLVHSYYGVENLLDILKPNLPLTHFRQLFSLGVNKAAIGLMANNYARSLKSVYILDGMEDFPLWYKDDGENLEEDPFVMLAWKCPNLTSFTLIGYEIEAEDVIAIARLRAEGLKELNIPLSCLLDDVEVEDVGEFTNMVSASLCRPWHLLQDDEVPDAVYDECADAEAAYNDLFLADQKYRNTKV